MLIALLGLGCIASMRALSGRVDQTTTRRPSTSVSMKPITSFAKTASAFHVNRDERARVILHHDSANRFRRCAIVRSLTFDGPPVFPALLRPMASR
jgi:hypothetical protein